jgi:hypothetical protein
VDWPWVVDVLWITLWNGVVGGNGWTWAANTLSQENNSHCIFNGAREWLLNILPRNQSMNISYSAGAMTGELEDVCDPEGRNPHNGKWPFILTTRSYTAQEWSW